MHSSSSDNDGGRDESKYRITMPLDVRLATPPPLFAAPSVAALPPTLPSVPVAHPPPLPAITTHPIVPAVHLPVHSGDSRPLFSVPSHPVRPADIVSQPPSLLPQLVHHQQQLVLPASMPAPVICPPRCRDYDGKSMRILVCKHSIEICIEDTQ